MIRTLLYASGAMAVAITAAGSLRAEEPPAPDSAASPAAIESAVPALAAEPARPAVEAAAPDQPVSPPPAPTAAAPAPLSPQAEALRAAITALPPGADDEERNERAALPAFYEARGWTPLWLTPPGELTPKASQLAAEIARSAEWGLDPRDFPLPARFHQRTAAIAASVTDASQPDADIARTETAASLTLLKYARHARGGRIINPSEQLSSYLDRRPQLLKPQAVLEGAAAAGQVDAYMRGLHPSHPQFELLRQKYLAVTGLSRQPGAAAKVRSPRGAGAEAKRLLANMEEWRWMPTDMGPVYIWNNIPEFMQRVIVDGQEARKERIITGEIGKQTPIFSRPLRKITFKPTWIVPDSIKVRELWPSLLRGGGLMREWALELRTKEGQPLDWRKVNWRTTDIRIFDVIQKNGPKSVMGKVKFSFPSQHTVFMHDTMERDKWMFSAVRRTYSHGCMRVANPMGLAHVVLREDKGWDAAHVNQLFNTGPLNNEIAIERKVMVHMTYFTAMVDGSGKLRTFPDVYGHERRITQALDGKWSQIEKGRDHLKPVELSDANVGRYRASSGDEGDIPEPRRSKRPGGGFFGSLFGDDS